MVTGAYKKLDLRIGELMKICIHQKDNSPKPVNHRLTLTEEPQVKSNNIRRFPAHDFLGVGFTLQTSRINKKRVISTFRFGRPRLMLKEGPKVKPVHNTRFAAQDFPYVGLPTQTSRTNNKQVISTFNFDYPRLTLKEGPKVESDHTTRFSAHDFL